MLRGVLTWPRGGAMATERPRRARWRPLRLVRWLALSLLALELLYVVGANLFLSLGGVAKAFEATDDINARFERAWTVWPGVIHVRGLRVVFHDHNVQWSLDMPRGRLDLELLELASRTFHATEVRGDGAVFRMRHRVAPEVKDRPHVRALPPIPEFEAPPVFEAHVPEPPVSDEDYPFWTVHIENVDADVAEIWAQQFRYVGAGRVRGSFRLRPARTLWVRPAELELRGGRLLAGDDVVARQLSGRIDCEVHPFDVEVPIGREVFRHISTAIELHAGGLKLDVAELFLEPSSRLGVRSGEGALRADLRVDRGRFNERSRLWLDNAELTVAHPEYEMKIERPTLSLHGLPCGHGAAVFGAAGGRLLRSGARGPPPRAGPLSVALESSSIDTAAAWSLVSAALHVPDLEVPDATWFADLLRGSGWSLASGAARGALRAEYRQGGWQVTARAALRALRARNQSLSMAGAAELQLDGARASDGASRAVFEADLAELALEGDGFNLFAADTVPARGEVARSATGVLDGWLALDRARWRGRVGELAAAAAIALRVETRALDARRQVGKLLAEVELQDGRLGDPRAGEQCALAGLRAAVLRGELALRGGRAPQASLTADLRGTSLRWDDFSLRGDGSLQGALDGSRLSLDVRARDLTLENGLGEGQGWVARLPALLVTARLTRQVERLRGRMALRAEGARGRIGSIPVASDLEADIELEDVDVARREALGTARVRFERASLEAGELSVSDWWATVELAEARISARENVDLNAPFTARLRDGLPALAALAAEGELPDWLPRLLPLRGLEVTGFVFRRCRLGELRVVQANGGPLRARGLFQTVPEQTRGAFLLRLDALEAASVGIAVDGRGSDVALLAGDDWLAQRFAELDDHARRAAPRTCPALPSACERATRARHHPQTPR